MNWKKFIKCIRELVNRMAKGREINSHHKIFSLPTQTQQSAWEQITATSIRRSWHKLVVFCFTATTSSNRCRRKTDQPGNRVVLGQQTQQAWRRKKDEESDLQV
jgi:hypothetical protein